MEFIAAYNPCKHCTHKILGDVHNGTEYILVVLMRRTAKVRKQATLPWKLLHWWPHKPSLPTAKLLRAPA